MKKAHDCWRTSVTKDTRKRNGHIFRVRTCTICDRRFQTHEVEIFEITRLSKLEKFVGTLKGVAHDLQHL